MAKVNQKKTTAKPGKKKLTVKKEKKLDTSSGINAKRFVEKLKTSQSAAELKKYHRYFKFDEGESSQGDTFIGVRMGQVFAFAKEFIDCRRSETINLFR